MRGNKKGIRKQIGHLYRIPLGDNLFGYGQVVTKVDHVFFDYRDDGNTENYNKILSSPIVFRCTIDRYVLSKGYWEIIRRFVVNPDYQKYEELFSYNPFTKNYQIFKQGTGFVPATPEEIQNLEVFASWGHTHIEQRLRDHFAGRPNYLVEGFKSRHLGKFCDMDTFYKPYGCVLLDKENCVYGIAGTKIVYE